MRQKSKYEYNFNKDGIPDLRVGYSMRGNRSHGEIWVDVVTYYTYKNNKWT